VTVKEAAAWADPIGIGTGAFARQRAHAIERIGKAVVEIGSATLLVWP
jgi:hypothetical protein